MQILHAMSIWPDIPKIFSLYNMTAAHRGVKRPGRRYETLDKRRATAAPAITEKECPQMIKVE